MFSLAGVAMVVSGKVTFSSLEPVDAGDSGAKTLLKKKVCPVSNVIAFNPSDSICKK